MEFVHVKGFSLHCAYIFKSMSTGRKVLFGEHLLQPRRYYVDANWLGRNPADHPHFTVQIRLPTYYTFLACTSTG